MSLTSRKFTVLALLLTLVLSFSSCKEKNQWDIPGVTGPTLTQIDDGLLISAVLENVHLDQGVRIPVPKYPNSYVELTPDLASAGTLLAIKVAAEDIDDMLNGGFELLDPTMLPGGRPLPGVQGGTLPGIAFNVEVLLDMTFYIGPKVFGVFVPVNLNLGGSIIAYRFYIKEKRLGNIAIVSNDVDGENGGFLLMLDLSEVLKKRIAEMAEKSRFNL